MQRPLSERELEVLRLAWPPKGTAVLRSLAALFVSPATVKTHFQHIYEKLGVRDRTAPVAHALRRAMIS